MAPISHCNWWPCKMCHVWQFRPLTLSFFKTPSSIWTSLAGKELAISCPVGRRAQSVSVVAGVDFTRDGEETILCSKGNRRYPSSHTYKGGCVPLILDTDWMMAFCKPSIMHWGVIDFTSVLCQRSSTFLSGKMCVCVRVCADST